MAWQHETLRQIPTKRGIDVVVSFEKDKVYIATKTFHFNSEKQIETGFETRMLNAEQNLQYNIDATAYEEQYPSNFTREDVEKMLIEKKYLQEGNKFEDLPIKSIAVLNG